MGPLSKACMTAVTRRRWERKGLPSDTRVNDEMNQQLTGWLEQTAVNLAEKVDWKLMSKAGTRASGGAQLQVRSEVSIKEGALLAGKLWTIYLTLRLTLR